jgi:hypothetical protein
LALGTGIILAAVPAAAAAPAPGWVSTQTASPTGPDRPGANPNDTWASVSCVSATFCAAAGYFSGTSSDLPLLGVETNGTWTTREAPLPGNAADNTPSRLSSVSCGAVGNCVAVGFYDDDGGSFHQHAVVETLADGAWTALDAPVPADGESDPQFSALLQKVDCTTAQACIAVGGYNGTTGIGGRFGLIDTERNGTWSAMPAPQPPGAAAEQQASLSGVSCPVVGPCAATGSYEVAGSEFPSFPGFLLQQSATGVWSAEDTPLPSNADTGTDPFASNTLAAVSCAAVCEAVGQVEVDAGSRVGLLEHLTGGTWTPLVAPEPSDAGTGSSQGAGLNDVACTFDGVCTAVGSYNDQSNGGDQPLIDTISRSAVTATRGPQPADTATGADGHGTLGAVSCVSGGACAAVGDYRNSSVSGMAAALTLTLSGGTWTAPTVPLPAGAGTGSAASAILNSVSCTFRGACEAVGNYADTAANGFGLVEAYVPPEGYWSVAADGGIFSYGPAAAFHGSTGGQHVNAPMVGMAVTPGGGGYWEVAADGGIFSYGNATFYGSTGGLRLNSPIVGMAATPDGGGYWLVAADGGIFTYGDAVFDGSAGAMHLNKPIVGMAATPDGHGYWLVASDGGIFTYGDATFLGSRGGQPLNEPIVGMAASASGLGYWLVASDGGVFSYGDASFLGSRGGQPLNKPIVTMLCTFDGAGYWLVAADGGIFSYGDTGFYGSAGSLTLNAPIVSGAAN